MTSSSPPTVRILTPTTAFKMSLSLRLAQRHVAYSLVHNRAAEDDAERIAAYATLRKSTARARPTLFNVHAFKAERPPGFGSPQVVRARTETSVAQAHAPRPPLRAYHSHPATHAPSVLRTEHVPRPRIAALVQQVCADAAPVRLARQIRARCG